MESGARASLKIVWDRVLDLLERELGPAEVGAWLRPLEASPTPDGAVELRAPDPRMAAWVEKGLRTPVAQAWARVTGDPVELRFSSNPSGAQGELFQGEARRERPRRAGPARGTLIEGYSFANFVVGPNNQFARAAAMAIAQQPGTLYNPLFIYGGVGLGKTHLANAVGHAILEAEPGGRVMFASSDGFTNQLIDAIAKNRAQEFKNRVRKLDVLIVDDVQFLAGRERTQEEFFHIFNSIYERGRQIILTSDKAPNELDGIEARLVNRFGWGLVADIQPPDTETRQAILERKARDEGIELPTGVASLIAHRIDSNIRDLEGALTRICAYASLNHTDITLDLARNQLPALVPEARSALGFEDIERGVLTHFGLRSGELKARKRTKKVAEARQIAMYLMRQHIGASFPQIGQYLGGRDHSTVVHACQAVEKRCRQDLRYRRMVDGVAKVIGCG